MVATSFPDGSGIILTSVDATNWVQRLSGTSNGLSSIAYGNGQFVAVGGIHGMSSVILTSGDGVGWSSRASGTYNRLMAVALLLCPTLYMP